MAVTNKKKSVWLKVGAIALLATSLSTPALAQPRPEGGRVERSAPSRSQSPRLDRGPQARPQRPAPAARPNDAGARNWQRNESRPRPTRATPERSQTRPEVRREPRANEIRRGLPGWAGGTRSGEPISPNGNARPNPSDRGAWQRGQERRNDDRRWDNDRRDNDSRWRDNDRRDNNSSRWRDNDRRDNNGRWRDNDRRYGNESWRGNDNRGRDWDRTSWRRDSRYDWQRYRDRNRSTYRIGRYYAPYQGYSYRRIGLGFSLGSMFYGNRYWINDPWQYRLPQTYGAYRWIRYYDDVLLVDTYTGQVVDVIYDFFW